MTENRKIEHLLSLYKGHAKLLSIWVAGFVLSSYLVYAADITSKVITGLLAVLSLLAVHRTKFRIKTYISDTDNCGYKLCDIKRKKLRRTLLIGMYVLLTDFIAPSPIIPIWLKALIFSIGIYFLLLRWILHEIACVPAAPNP